MCVFECIQIHCAVVKQYDGISKDATQINNENNKKSIRESVEYGFGAAMKIQMHP